MAKHAVNRKPLPQGWALARIVIYSALVGLGAFLVAWGVVDQETVDTVIPVVMGAFTSFAGTMAIANVPASEKQVEADHMDEIGNLPPLDYGTQEGATPPEYKLDGTSETVSNPVGHLVPAVSQTH